MKLLLLLFLVATTILASASIPNQIHPLKPQSGAAGHHIPGINCLSWRLAVETDNIRDWDVVPAVCENYVGHYMLGHQYRKDCNAAAAAAYEYAKNLTLKGDGKDAWVFDIDDTSLSNLPYYALPENAFGAKEYNETSFQEWELKGVAPPVPATLHLYNKLLHLGYKIVFLSGKKENLRAITEKNMKNSGYHTWEKLILKQSDDSGLKALVYKSKKRTALVKAGYRILGNLGDQWSDLLGLNPDEIQGIMKDFDEPGSLAPTGLHLCGTKYMVIQGESGALIRGKKETRNRGSGGVTVKKTGQALVLGIYEEPVTPGQCSMLVESWEIT